MGSKREEEQWWTKSRVLQRKALRTATMKKSSQKLKPWQQQWEAQQEAGKRKKKKYEDNDMENHREKVKCTDQSRRSNIWNHKEEKIQERKLRISSKNFFQN